MTQHNHSTVRHKKILPLTLAAIGIVFGDLGTSPLYAFRESLHGLALVEDNIFGVLSLIFWSLMLIISLKYLVLILRADNHGEGGILSMLALIKKKNQKAFKFFIFTAILGTSLLIGDGIITPAISVVSAIEGLKVISPIFSHLTLPITVVILCILYFCQHYGTEKIARFFGPILLIWFLTIGILGASKIAEYSHIYQAMNPYYALHFFKLNGVKGFTLLGAVFLVVTGGEALYADLGLFGKKPIRYGWFGLVLPCLLLNYFGQGAHVLNNPESITNPFYALAPNWFSYPLLLIATLAAIIASQAVISATFNLVKQAVLLDFYPRIPIIQTSDSEKGQVYIPLVNIFLAVGTLCFLLIFKNSSAMAGAYGISVNMEMITVTILTSYVAYKIWKWNVISIIALFSLILFIEISFFASNAQKMLHGGWAPILFAIFCVSIMLTWYRGVKFLQHYFKSGHKNLEGALVHLKTLNLKYIQDTTMFCIADPYDKNGVGLTQYFKLNQLLPENIVILNIVVENMPYIDSNKRYKMKMISENIYGLTIRVGFMQLINIPHSLAIAKRKKIFPFDINLKKASYLIEITNISATERKYTFPFYWQEKLFAFLKRNSSLDIDFYHLPYNRTIAIGRYCEI